MNDLENKLLQNEIPELKRSDWDIITSDEHLLDLFFRRLKEGLIFDTSDLNEEITGILLSPENMKYFLNNYIRSNPRDFINLYVSMSDDVIDEIGEDTYNEMITYYNDY